MASPEQIERTEAPTSDIEDVGEVRRMCAVLEDDLDRAYLQLDRLIAKVEPVRAHRPSPGDPDEAAPAMETEVGARLARSAERVRAIGGHLQDLVDTIEV